MMSRVARLTVSGFPSPARSGVTGTYTVRAVDQFGTPVKQYRGTVALTTSDPLAVGPPVRYTFGPQDGGKRTFTAALMTAGVQTITAVDVITPSLAGVQGVIVLAPVPPPPPPPENVTLTLEEVMGSPWEPQLVSLGTTRALGFTPSSVSLGGLPQTFQVGADGTVLVVAGLAPCEVKTYGIGGAA